MRRGALASLLASLPAGSLAAQDALPFTSEHAARGVIYNMMLAPPISNPQDGFGLALADLDGDGDLDLVLLGRTDGLVGIYRNNGSGVFTNASATSGIAATPAGCGVAAFDFDRDGDLDLYLAQRNQPSRLWRNDGNLAFTDVTAAAGLVATVPASGVSVSDFDADGHLDLHLCIYSPTVANRLYRNLGDGTFTDVGPALGLASLGLSYQSAWSDFDRDGDADLVTSNDRGTGNVPNQLHRNDGGTFTDVSAATGMDVSLCSMGVACGDLDGSLRPDFYFTNLPDAAPPLMGANPLLLANAKGTFTQAQAAWGVAHHRMSWAAILWDFDSDADLDLYVNSEFQPNSLYRQGNALPMVDVAAALGVAGTTGLSFVSAIGDLDRDGDLDLVQNNYGGAVRLFMNREGSRRPWLRLRIAGEGRVRDAIGASATVFPTGPKGGARPPQWREVLCGGNGYLGQNETTLHFGLGTAVAVESVEVRWPNGGPTRTLRSVPASAEWTVHPPGSLGDANLDGTVDHLDWASFAATGLGPVVAGREMLDFDGNFILDASDVAAFRAASSTPFGDLDGDGAVGGADLASLLGAWGTGGVPADLDLDGTVGGTDLATMLGNWSSP